MDDSLSRILISLAPLIILQLLLTIGALIDLIRREHVSGGSKVPWALLILLVSGVGAILYLVFGRKGNIERDSNA